MFTKPMLLAAIFAILTNVSAQAGPLLQGTKLNGVGLNGVRRTASTSTAPT